MFMEKNDDFFIMESYFNLQWLYNTDEGETKFYHTYVPL